jgi:hypothetical protein
MEKSKRWYTPTSSTTTCVCVSVSTLGFKKAIVRFGSLNTHIPSPPLFPSSYCMCMFPVFSLCVCVSPVTCEKKKEEEKFFEKKKKSNNKRNCVCVCKIDTHIDTQPVTKESRTYRELCGLY